MEVTLQNFRTILVYLKENKRGLKVKTLQGWIDKYLQVIGFISASDDQINKNFSGVVLSDLQESEGMVINNISAITAFQLEAKWQEYKPNKIYTLTNNESLKALIIH